MCSFSRSIFVDIDILISIYCFIGQPSQMLFRYICTSNIFESRLHERMVCFSFNEYLNYCCGFDIKITKLKGKRMPVPTYLFDSEEVHKFAFLKSTLARIP